ncbi:hypothetical protein NEFER03_0154 [Nematocida sp. LUAm3]|nr:hypothetical protein NEFER03_0154 [Nematocida sp. LUAm3]KAI5173607.1 hypothetical protein NEFER02_0123 [Nematocida sp. LUAm2]KAI5176828.1 hypothetical protein NEFER01_0153 [Nematocida sp. LUAm1]
MPHSEKEANICHMCTSGFKEMSQEFQRYAQEIEQKTEELLNKKETEEKRRLEILLQTISEHLNKNVASLFESVIQREIRTHLSQRIEKVIQSKIDQKLNELSGNCMQAIAMTFENKGLQHVIGRSIKAGVMEGITNTVENGMNEIRLQVLDQMKSLSFSADHSMHHDDALSVDTKDDTLTNIVDSIRDDEFIKYADSPCEIISHLLETNILECFSYAVNAGDPDVFLFFIEKMPIDAEMDLPNDILISFIIQLVSVGKFEWKKDTSSKRIKHVLLLNNALAHIDSSSIRQQDFEILQKHIAPLRTRIEHFGCAPEEQETLSIMQRLGI